MNAIEPSMIKLSKSDFLNQHAILWAPINVTAASVLVVSASDSNGKYRSLGSVPVADADGAWALIEPAAANGQTTYISLNARAIAPTTGSTGKSDTVELLSNLFVDIDIAAKGTEHAMGDRNPDQSMADRWRGAGLEPSVTIHSGAGFHLYWALAEPLDASSDLAKELLARHRAFWAGVAEADDRNIDLGPLTNLAQMPRPAGTWNAKQGKPVKARGFRHTNRYTVKQLFARYPKVDMEVGGNSPANRSAPTHNGIPRVLDPNASIGDRFAVEVPVGQFAYQVFNTETKENGAVTFPRSDGSVSRESNSKLFDDGAAGEQRLTIFGSRVINAFNLDGQNNSLTSWDLLGKILGGDFRLAAKVLASTLEDDQWAETFFEAARSMMTEEIAQAFAVEQDPDYILPAPPGREEEPRNRPNVVNLLVSDVYDVDSSQIADSERLTPGLAALLARADDAGTEVKVLSESLNVVDALIHRIPARFDIGSTKTVFLNGEHGRHGIYRRSIDSDSKQEAFVRLTDWVMLKVKNVENRTIGDDGSELASTEVTVTLAISLANGFIKVMPGFTLEQAHNVRVAIDMLNVDVMIPERDSDTRSVVNVIRVLASEGGGGERTSQFGSLGWMRKPDKCWVYLAPAGSITANGSTDEFKVGGPPKSDNDALNSVQQGYGWDTSLKKKSEIVDAAKCIMEYLKITPTKPAAYAALAILWAAPLALERRTTVFLAGLPDNGKSLLAAAAQAFLCGEVTSANWTGGPIAETSAFAAGIQAAWARHGVTIFDDYRVPQKNPKKAADMFAVVSTVMQYSYGNASVGGKGKQDGGLRGQRSAFPSGIITGEALPEEAGVVSRGVNIHLGHGDVAMTPTYNSQYDTFAAQYAKKAHLLYAAYLQFLARRLDAAGTLQAFRTANNRTRSSVASTSGRSAEGVSYLSTGWAVFAEFAAEVGIPQDFYPDPAARAKTAVELSGSNETLVANSNPASKIIKTARDMIAGNVGHLVRADGHTPSGDELDPYGWKIIDGGSHAVDIYRESGIKIGVVSKDRQWIVLTSNAVAEISRRFGFDSIPKEQLDGGFATLVMKDTTPGGRSPASVTGAGRPRGYTLPAALFDISMSDPTPLAVAA